MISAPSHSSYDEKRPEGVLVPDAPLEIDPVAERRLIRKLDLRLMPCLVISYLLGFIDRSNAGNAKVAGLSAEIGLGNWGFNIGTCLYYVIFIVCEVPSIMLLRRFGNRLVPLTLHQDEGRLLRSEIAPWNGGIFRPTWQLVYHHPGMSQVASERMDSNCGHLSGAFGGLMASGLLRVFPMGPVHTWRPSLYGKESSRWVWVSSYSVCTPTVPTQRQCSRTRTAI
ncbi:hypothetical protein C8R43DRAFT_169257 [Mycena crocata]|nr:hypothetical protein C8R43DRAFT_169257 [Mycena crocata]